MAESEKLTALKKAYADIILNTAKEAAARIMVSEKKAQRFQRELFAAKDEGLRMLVRLKQMLDSKVSETEMTSLSQQRKIEELEAQLGEAEDIVKDLRAELRELHDELEKVTNNQIQDELGKMINNQMQGEFQDEFEKVTNNHMQALGEQNSGGGIAAQLTTLEENRVSTSVPVMPCLPMAQCDRITTLETKNSSLNGTYDGHKCYDENVSCVDNWFVCNPEFHSMMMRSKEPELYRNGCTQRIRAIERNLLLENMSLSGKVDVAKNQIVIRDYEGKHQCQKLSAPSDKIPVLEKGPNEVKAIQADGNCIQVHGARSFCRKRKRATRHMKHKAPSFRSFPREFVDNNIQSGQDSMATEDMAQKDPESPIVTESTSNTNEMIMQSGYIEVSKTNTEFLRACIAKKATNEDKLLIDELQFAGQEIKSAESSKPSASRTDLEVAHVILVNSDQKDFDETEAHFIGPMNNKLLKYTFQRKRRKKSLISPDGDSSIYSNILKRKMGENESGSQELQKSSLITESSSDGRRLAQVARQLLSLSEKKW